MWILKAVSHETRWHCLQPKHIKKSVITLAIPIWLDMMAKYVAVLILINYLREKSLKSYEGLWRHQLKFHKHNDSGYWEIIRSETEIFQQTTKSWEFKDCTEPMKQMEKDCCLLLITLYRKRGIASRQLLGTIIAFIFWKNSHAIAVKIKNTNNFLYQTA